VIAAHAEADAILVKGKADAEAARADMEKEVQASAVDLAVVMAERLLTGVLSPDEKHKLIAKHIKDIESVKTS
jgi:F0F1-type ATP synthase membrane subunit b/b'